MLGTLVVLVGRRKFYLTFGEVSIELILKFNLIIGHLVLLGDSIFFKRLYHFIMLFQILPVLSFASCANLVIGKRNAIVKVSKQKYQVMLFKGIFLKETC